MIQSIAASTNLLAINAALSTMIFLIEDSIESSKTSSCLFQTISSQTELCIQAFDEIESATVENSGGSIQTMEGDMEIRDNSQSIKETSSVLQNNSDQINYFSIEESETSG